MSHGSFSDIGDPAASEIDEVVQTDQNGHGSSEDDTVQPADVLEERKSKLNTLFGFLPWDLPLSRAAAETAPPPDPGEATIYTFGNVMWSILFGWWMALFYIVASVVLFVSIVGIPYGKLCWRLASYVFWPFGKYVVEKATQYNRNPGRETSSLIVRPYAGPHSIRNIAGYVVWLLMLIVLVLPMQAISLVITWLTIVPIPMAKVNLEIIRLLFRKPLHIAIEPDYSTAQSHVIKICTHQAFNIYYFKFRIWGMNIIFVNLFPLVVFTVIESYAVPEHYALPPVAKFFVDLVCTVPITFYIGMAISSIAAQTNYMVGAVLHATFGSITELILYGSALRHGGFDILVTFAVTGGLLSDMLLVPGLSMIVGGFRYKEQKFNTLASGVSSILLFISVIGIFTPTIFYHTYGSFHQQCKECHFPPVLNHTNLNDTAENITMPLMQIAQSIGTLFNTNTSTNETTNDTSVSVAEVFCSGCVYYQDDLDNDPMFTGAARNIMYFSAGVLPLAYIIGLLFTFRTHSHIFEDVGTKGGQQKANGSNKKIVNNAEEDDESQAPEWSIPFSCIFMLISTLLYALIAENIVHELEDTISALKIHQAFLGLTFIALVPAITQIINAIKFALHDQIALSVQIGSASAIQISLIQIPVLIVMSAIINHGIVKNSFVMLFPMLTVFAVVFAVLTYNYIQTEGRTTYFKGAAMLIMYTIFIVSYWFFPRWAMDPTKIGEAIPTTAAPARVLRLAL